MAQYEEWVNTLSERHQDYVFFLSKGLSPPISTRTMKVVAEVMGVPSVIHDDDKIMEAAKALAFHHFRLRGEVPPAGVATAGRPGDMAEPPAGVATAGRSGGVGGASGSAEGSREDVYEYVVTVRRDEDVEAVLGRRMDVDEWHRFKRNLRYSLDYCVPDEINRVLVDNFGKDSEAASACLRFRFMRYFGGEMPCVSGALSSFCF